MRFVLLALVVTACARSGAPLPDKATGATPGAATHPPSAEAPLCKADPGPAVPVDPVAGAGCEQAIDFFAVAKRVDEETWRLTVSTAGAGNESAADARCGFRADFAEDVVLRLAPPAAMRLAVEVESQGPRASVHFRAPCDDALGGQCARVRPGASAKLETTVVDPDRPIFLLLDGEDETQAGRFEVTVRSPHLPGLDELCDDMEPCEDGLECSRGHGPGRCRPRDGPLLEVAEAWLSEDEHSLGVRIRGRSASTPVADATVAPISSSPAEPLPLPLIFDSGGGFRGEMSWRLPMAVGGHVHSFRGDSHRWLATLVVHHVGRGSTSFELYQKGAPAPAALGALCDPNQAFTRCVTGTACDAEPGQPAYCRAPVVECPPNWNVVELAPTAEPHGWEHSGVLDGPDLTYTGCGTRGPDRAHRFTAPTAGFYVFAHDDRGRNAATLQVRRFCEFEDSPSVDRFCHHETSPHWVGVQLAAGETVFAIIDAVLDVAIEKRPYRLSVRAVPRRLERVTVFDNPEAGSLAVTLEGTWPKDSWSGTALSSSVELHRERGCGYGRLHVGASARWTRSEDDRRIAGIERRPQNLLWGAEDGQTMARVKLPDHEPIWTAVSRPRALAVGDPCDPSRATGVCPKGAVCLGDPPVCRLASDACPPDWNARDLGEHRIADDFWRLEGTTDGARDRTTGCPYPAHDPPPSGREVVHRFVAPRTGRYEVRLVSSGATRPQRLYARSHCGIDAPGAERACAVEPSAYNPAAGFPIVMSLTGDEPVYLVVEDSSTSPTGGPYLLTVRHLGEPASRARR